MANERYAAFDGREALKIVSPAETGALIASQRRQRLFPFFFVELLGNLVVSRVCGAADVLWRYLFAGAVVFCKAVRYLWRKIWAAGKQTPLQMTRDAAGIHRDLSMLREGAKRNKQNRGFVFVRAHLRYLHRSFRLRRTFWQTLRNIILPLLALAVLLGAAVRLRTTTPALQVRLGDTVVGYAADETVVQQALADLRDMLPQNGDRLSEALGDTPSYQLKRVPLSALSGSAQLSAAMLAGAKTSLVPACGIYIDGTFLCAVRNESDAVSAFHRLIAPVRQKAKPGRQVAFVETIDYVQGLYADDAQTLWDPLTLLRTLRTPKSEAVYYKVQPNDTLASIKKSQEISGAMLRARNPGVDFDRLTAGLKLLIQPQTDYVRVKEMEFIRWNSVVPFETVQRESETLRAGTTKILQTGKNGKQQTTEMITYIDGKKISDAVVSVQQTSAPVQQIILIGTQSPYQSYGGAGGGSSRSGFIWPAVGAYTLSSGFGYRSARISGRSFHGGVDIVKPGGHSTGAPVIAAAAGRVTVAQNGYRGYGHTVVIDHGNGLETRYAHMKPGSITVRVGQTVSQGQQIGQIGSTGNVTGPHLHFEVMKNGTKVNPMNYIG